MTPTLVGFTAYTLSASAATPFGMAQLVAVPPCAAKFVEELSNVRATFAASGPPTLRVSRIQQRLSGV
jgi:hypothetical protein